MKSCGNLVVLVFAQVLKTYNSPSVSVIILTSVRWSIVNRLRTTEDTHPTDEQTDTLFEWKAWTASFESNHLLSTQTDLLRWYWKVVEISARWRKRRSPEGASSLRDIWKAIAVVSRLA